MYFKPNVWMLVLGLYLIQKGLPNDLPPMVFVILGLIVCFAGLGIRFTNYGGNHYQK